MPIIQLEPGDGIFLEGHPETAGSLGLKVRDRNGGGELLLTAAHVVGSLARYHASTVRVATTGGPLIGELHRTVPADDEARHDPPVTCRCDAATIRPRDDVRCSRAIDGVDVAATQYDLENHDYEDVGPVFIKRGQNTGVTEGVLVGPADFRGRSPIGDIYIPSCLLVDSLGIAPFARDGDSGAVVVDRDGAVLGIVVGMTKPTVADPTVQVFCSPIGIVLDALEVDLIGPA